MSKITRHLATAAATLTVAGGMLWAPAGPLPRRPTRPRTAVPVTM
ncbi:hypothetical protein ABGB17_37640 [Sphaerisporangium sp. B11E5]